MCGGSSSAWFPSTLQLLSEAAANRPRVQPVIFFSFVTCWLAFFFYYCTVSKLLSFWQSEGETCCTSTSCALYSPSVVVVTSIKNPTWFISRHVLVSKHTGCQTARQFTCHLGNLYFTAELSPLLLLTLMFVVRFRFVLRAHFSCLMIPRVFHFIISRSWRILLGTLLRDAMSDDDAIFDYYCC